MNPVDAYKFCPVCSLSLFPKGERLLSCKSGHKLYINPIPCNAAIIENENQEILLVKRRVDPKKGCWDWPGGFIEPNEDLEKSVKREIKEELGVRIEITKTVGVYSDKYLFGGIEYPTLCLVVAAKITGGELKASDDVDGFEFIPEEEVLDRELAFDSIKLGISDYLKQKVEIPS